MGAGERFGGLPQADKLGLQDSVALASCSALAAKFPVGTGEGHNWRRASTKPFWPLQRDLPAHTGPPSHLVGKESSGAGFSCYAWTTLYLPIGVCGNTGRSCCGAEQGSESNRRGVREKWSHFTGTQHAGPTLSVERERKIMGNMSSTNLENMALIISLELWILKRKGWRHCWINSYPGLFVRSYWYTQRKIRLSDLVTNFLKLLVNKFIKTGMGHFYSLCVSKKVCQVRKNK